MTETPKYIDTQSVDDKIDTLNVNRELIDSILEKNWVNNEVADVLYDKIINEISSIEVNADDYISTWMLDWWDIDEWTREEKEFFQKIVESRNKSIDALIKFLSESSDKSALRELFQYNEKLSSIVDSVINNEENIVEANTWNDIKEESFMDKLANSLWNTLIPWTMKHNNDVKQAYASMWYEPWRMKN